MKSVGRKRWKLVRMVIWMVTVVNVLFLALFVAVYAVPLPDRETGWSTVVEYRDGTPAHVFLSPDDKWRLQVDLDAVDPKLVEALIALEDKRFWDHDGVDPIAIGRAAWSNLSSGHRVSGGSTITMQLARLLEPRPRTIPSKLIDMFRAAQLDLRISKREILAEYLSRTPYGDNVEGVESAAWAYFGHGARHLTAVEIATLLAVPQGPQRFKPRPDNTVLRARRDAILRKLIDAEVVTGADATAALVELADPPPEALRPMPREARHAAIELRAKYPDRDHIRSTLEAGAQALVEREVALRTPELHRKQIYGGSIVVVDHVTREVVALAGNLDFDDAQHGGQIAMFDRPRSPGSTLKPMLYALAIDRGIALPGYLVADVPNQYGTYRPRNFDNDFAGLVTLKESLVKSLNLPFIDLLARLGVDQFLGELERMDIAGANAIPGTYGLSMIVGGIELSPLEVAGLYATLAEDGSYLPLRLTMDETVPVSPSPIFAPGAAFLTRQALMTKDRPDFPRRRDLSTLPPDIHWKTGTSFGFRDAWAVGSGPRYTTVVWTGNVDNRPSAELVGSEAAGPLLFDVLEGLSDRTRRGLETPPAALTEIEVCAYSGHVASDACPTRRKVSALIHAVPTTPCPYHQTYEVDRETGLAVTPACRRAGHDYDRRSFVVLPSSVTAWLADRHRTVPDAPVFQDGCTGETGGPPVMVLPGEGLVITLIPGMPAHQQAVPLSASTRAGTLSWFVDGALIATGPSSQRQFWTPTTGRHSIVVADATGRKARRVVEVR